MTLRVSENNKTFVFSYVNPDIIALLTYRALSKLENREEEDKIYFLLHTQGKSRNQKKRDEYSVSHKLKTTSPHREDFELSGLEI